MANGMFFNPEEALAAERQARMGLAMQAGATPVGASAQELGRSLAGAFGGVIGAPSQESPIVKQARQRQALVSGLDMTDLESLANASRAALQAGDVEFGTALADRYMTMAKSMQGESGSNALKQMRELIAQGEDPYVAQGIAYGTYRQFNDPSTGDIGYIDLRGNRPVRGSERNTVGGIIREGTRKQEKFDANLKDFGEFVAKSNIVSTETTLSEIEGILSGLAAKGETDIPGYGATGWVPGVAISKEGQNLRTRLAKLFNMTLKDRSGAAVTSQELDRLKEEFNTGAMKTDRQLLDGIKLFRREFNRIKQSLAAGYDQEIVNAYSERSGINFYKSKPQQNKATFRYNPTTGKLEPK